MVRKIDTKKHLGGFEDFLREQGVVGLAVGLVVGAASATLVKSLIDNVVMPPLGFILGSAEGLKGLSLSLGYTPTGKATWLNYGVFLNDLINFIILAAVVYIVVHMMGLDRRFGKKKDEPAPPVVEKAKIPAKKQ